MASNYSRHVDLMPTRSIHMCTKRICSGHISFVPDIGAPKVVSGSECMLMSRVTAIFQSMRLDDYSNGIWDIRLILMTSSATPGGIGDFLSQGLSIRVDFSLVSCFPEILIRRSR